MVKGQKLSQKQKEILLVSHLGKSTPQSVRDKIAKANTGKKRTAETKKKMGAWQIGKFVKEETRKKIGLANIGNIPWNKGRRMTKEYRENISGEKSSQWKGGITKEHLRIKNSIDYRLWREAVFARDNWTCQKTGVRGEKLHPHHIKNFAQYPELRFAIDNGVTLSEKSHKEFHKKYGVKNNTQAQIDEFLNLC